MLFIAHFVCYISDILKLIFFSFIATKKSFKDDIFCQKKKKKSTNEGSSDGS